MNDTAVLVTTYCAGEHEEEQRRMTKILCRNLFESGHFVVLASHTPIDLETQNYCHIFVYDSDNSFSVNGIPSNHNRNHGIAELRSFHNALDILPKKFKYVFKLAYDNNPDLDYHDIISKCKKTNKKLVTGKWGNDVTFGLHTCFFDVDFFRETFSWDELYRFENSVNIEHVWFESVRDKNLLEETHRELYHTPPYFFGYYINDYSNDGGKSIQHYPHS